LSGTEKALLWIAVIIALLLGGYAAYETTVINTKGENLQNWAKSAQLYIAHWHDAHHPGGGTPDHNPPPPPPPGDW
jgi:hypothetical protein